MPDSMTAKKLAIGWYYIRLENGLEFTTQAIRDCRKVIGIGTLSAGLADLERMVTWSVATEGLASSYSAGTCFKP